MSAFHQNPTFAIAAPAIESGSAATAQLRTFGVCASINLMDEAPEQIDVVVNPEGSKRWVLLRRPDGLHSYAEHSLEDVIYHVDKDGGERHVAAPARWTRTYQSGLLDSEDVARSDSFDNLPWLFAAILEARSHVR